MLEELLHGVVLASVLAGLYPRTAIQVIVQVIHDDGSVRTPAPSKWDRMRRSSHPGPRCSPLVQLLAASINGAMLALLDAGISMRATVTASTAAFLPGSPDVLLDPTAEETAVRACAGTRTPTQPVQATPVKHTLIKHVPPCHPSTHPPTLTRHTRPPQPDAASSSTQ